MSYIQLKVGDNEVVLNGKGAKPKGQKEHKNYGGRNRTDVMVIRIM